MIGLSGEIPLVSHSDVTSLFPPSGNGGYASNLDVTSRVQSNKNSTLKLSHTLVFACAVQVWYNDVFAQVAEMFV